MSQISSISALEIRKLGNSSSSRFHASSWIHTFAM